MAAGTVLIEDLVVSCVIGVHAWERQIQQRLTVTLEVETDFTAAAEGDNLARTVDYAALAELTAGIARDGRFKLLETLGERIADAVLGEPGVSGVVVTIRKPAAVPSAAAVGVRLRRPA